mmetsp:Transcript_2760/g.4038  ORF Transcript_2760/g.4038 Transcript_2760/m.4038 type:complete len:153 (+) Transcript_2760:391-849(+)
MPGSRQLTMNSEASVNAISGQYKYAAQNGTGVLSSIIQKYKTKELKPPIKGTVKKLQNGQHGPATTNGDPSLLWQINCMAPTCREQQQKIEFKSSTVPVQHFLVFPAACSRSHLVETAYCILDEFLLCSVVSFFPSILREDPSSVMGEDILV